MTTKGVKDNLDLEKCRRSDHNIPILKMMMDEFLIQFSQDTSHYVRQQRLLTLEVLLTLLLKRDGVAKHPKLITDHQTKYKRNIACKPCGVSKLCQLYALIDPIVSHSITSGVVQLNPKVREALVVDVAGFWEFKDKSKHIKFQGILGKAKLAERSNVSLAERKDIDKSEHDEDGAPASKVARIEPVSRAGKSTSESLNLDDNHEKYGRSSAGSKNASVVQHEKEAQSLPVMRNRSTMTRVTEITTGKADTATNTNRMSSNLPRDKDSQMRTLREDRGEKIPYTRVFHCHYCDRVPRDHVVMDARCGRLIGCRTCLKERGRSNIKICVHCGYRGRYILLKNLHEKLLKMR